MTTQVATLLPEMRGAFRQKLLTIAGLPAVAWQGMTFEPVAGAAYAAEEVAMADSNPRPFHGVIKQTIRLMLTLSYPAGKGTLALETMAAAIVDAFPVHSVIGGAWLDDLLVDSGGNVLAVQASNGYVVRSEHGPLRQDAEFLSCKVTITVVTYTDNG